MKSMRWVGERTQRLGSVMPAGQWAIMGEQLPPSWLKCL